MKIIRGLNNIKNIENLSLTIGNFDGVHFGHQKIINSVQEKAKNNNLKSAILTFFPHPINYFKPQSTQNFLINSLAQKLNFFKQNSIDYVFLINFNSKFAEISSKEFIEEILINKLNTKNLTIGYDFIFGKNRSGNFNFLKKYQNNFKTQQISALKQNNITISSTNIRKFIQNGEIIQANNFLDKNFAIKGIIINGEKIGREVGFKTANMIAKNHLILPKFGVYKSKIFIKHLNKEFKSITNFGIRPTFNNNSEPLFETHIFDYDDKNYGNLYHKSVELELIDFIRDEKKFDSINELKTQIEQDIFQAKN